MRIVKKPTKQYGRNKPMFTVSGKDVCNAHALLVERSVKCGEVFVKVLVEDNKGERITIQIPEDDLGKDVIDKLFSFKYSQIFPKDLSTILDENECDLLLNFPGGSVQTKNSKKGFVMIDKIVIDDSGEAHTYYVEPYGMIQFDN